MKWVASVTLCFNLFLQSALLSLCEVFSFTFFHFLRTCLVVHKPALAHISGNPTALGLVPAIKPYGAVKLYGKNRNDSNAKNHSNSNLWANRLQFGE